jgi:hypothetical protein
MLLLYKDNKRYCGGRDVPPAAGENPPTLLLINARELI